MPMSGFAVIFAGFLCTLYGELQAVRQASNKPSADPRRAIGIRFIGA